MTRIRLKCFVCLCALSATCIVLLRVFFIGPSNVFTNDTSVHRSLARGRGFLVNTPGCKIPDVDPFDETIRHMILPTRTLKCNATPAITYSEGNWLKINRTALLLYYSDQLDYCIYQALYRSGVDTDNAFLYNKSFILFYDDIELTAEFVRVACYGRRGDMIYQNFHALILKKNDTEYQCDRKHNDFLASRKPREILNILAVGVDSISRLNFVRKMPRTRKYLLDNLRAVELQGYNKVADNTYVNIVPMFTGKYVEELPWDERNRSTPFDAYSFLWKNFSARGYRTLFAEDAPQIAIFNYGKAGFHKQPMDYYLRPFSLALEQHGSLWNTHDDCVGPKLETNVVLDWVTAFLDTFAHKPHFAFAFLTRLTHDDINKAGFADIPYLNFLQKLDKDHHFNNTVMIFFSDHGMRFGSLRETYIGKLEERLPFMYVAVPKWFEQKYPTHWRNLRLNANRLSTPFDIYETLKDVLEFDGNLRDNSLSQRGCSLFSEVPRERTCEHASILPHWCSCHQKKKVETSSAVVRDAVRKAINVINEKLIEYGELCARLSVDSIQNAFSVAASDKILRFQNSVNDVLHRTVLYGERTVSPTDYLLTFKARPGGGLFEVTVRYNPRDKSFQIVGDISRINKYGNQADCIDVHRHKKFCYCK